MSLSEVINYYTKHHGWSEQEADDNRFLAEEARAHFAHVYPEPRSPKDRVRVYVMQDARGFVKVGISKNPYSRANDLSAGNPTRVKVIYETRAYSRLYAAEIEAAVHDFLAGAALGREWFKCDYEEAMAAIYLMGGIGEHPE